MAKITDFLNAIINFINTVIVPFIFAIAFLLFIVGVFRFFIAGADNPEKRQQGVQFVMYALIGFFLMMSLWGLVNVVRGSFSLESNNMPCVPTFGNTQCSNSGTSNSSGVVPNNFAAPGTSTITCVTPAGNTVTVSRDDCAEYGGTVR